jgi:hypothetical protein
MCTKVLDTKMLLSATRVRLSVLYRSQNKKRPFACTEFTDWFLKLRWSFNYVFAYDRLTQHTCKYIKSYIRLHASTFKKSSSGLSQNVKRETTV